MAAGNREMVVFISYENKGSAETIGREMVQALEIGRAEYGVDMFTGGCEVRIPYSDSDLTRIRAWLVTRGVVYDMNLV